MRRIACVVFLSAASVFAQPAGLDALPEDRVLSELAARRLTGLLERAFEVGHVPAAKRAAILARVGFSTLRQRGATMPAAELDALVTKLVRESPRLLPGMDDPAAIMEDAGALLLYGVQRDLQVLEYWGESPRTQAKLRPTVDAVLAMCQRAATLAAERAEQVANSIKGGNDTAGVERWTQLNTLAETAAYTAQIVRYYQSLTLDRSDTTRAKVATEAADYLRQFDVEDNPDRPFVRVTLGKLAMAVGSTASMKTAHELFQSVIGSPADVVPIAQQFEARFFLARLELDANRPADAAARFAELEAWVKSASLNDAGVVAATKVLSYRLAVARADAATDAASRETARAEAARQLSALVESTPSLRGVVYEQLAAKLPSDAKIESLDVVMLEAVFDRGRAEATKPQDAVVDATAVKRAIAAAEELIKRGPAAVSTRVLESARFVRPFLLDRIGDAATAAAAYLEVAPTANLDAERATLALNNAEAAIGRLRKAHGDDAAIGALEDKFLAVAVAPPFNRTALRYRYAYRLQKQGKTDDAIEVLRGTPKDDANAAAAKYLLTVLLDGRLAAMTTDDPRREPAATEVATLAGEVASETDTALAAAEESNKSSLRSRSAGVRLLSARLALAASPQQALERLDQFETLIAGLPDAARLGTEALKLKVAALRQLGRLQEAAAQLQALSETGGTAGVASIVGLLNDLSGEFDAAQKRGDKDAMRQIAASRAMLTPQLVKWAERSGKPDHRKLVYRYGVLDADTQRLAADLAENGADRDTLRRAALSRYEQLQSEANFKLFLEELPTAQRSATTYDPAVVLGIARLQFQLGDHRQALQRLQTLLEDRTVGSPTVLDTVGGIEKEVDNDLYWEVVVRFVQASLAVDGNSRDAMAKFVKLQFVQWRDRTGGTRWRKEMTKLKDDLAPGWIAEE